MSPQSRKLAMNFSIFLPFTFLMFKVGQWSHSFGKQFCQHIFMLPSGAKCLYGPLMDPKDLNGAKIGCAGCAL